jgi:cell division inhibitor SepF
VHGALAVKPEAVPLQSARTQEPASARPATVKLTGFSEARIIGEKYRDGQSVILDMTDMSDSDARRLVDFSAGLAFSLRGSIDKVAPKVFMLLPPDADIAAVASHYADSAAH